MRVVLTRVLSGANFEVHLSSWPPLAAGASLTHPRGGKLARQCSVSAIMPFFYSYSLVRKLTLIMWPTGNMPTVVYHVNHGV